MLKRLRSLFRVAQVPARFRTGHDRGDALPHRAIHATTWCVPACPPRKRLAAPASNSAAWPVSQEECREARGLHLFDELLGNCRHAARLLRKTPGFTATALLTLAVCLGANLTIFAVIDSILLRPLPFPECGPAGHRLQYLSKGRRRSRRLLGNQLLRTPRPDSRVRLARHLPLRHGNPRRARRNGTRADGAGVSGVLLNAGDWSRDGTQFHGGGDLVSNQQSRDSHGRLLAAAFQCRPARDRQADPRGRRSAYGGRRFAARLPLPLLRSAVYTSLSRRARKIVVPSSGIPAEIPSI